MLLGLGLGGRVEQVYGERHSAAIESDQSTNPAALMRATKGAKCVMW